MFEDLKVWEFDRIWFDWIFLFIYFFLSQGEARCYRRAWGSGSQALCYCIQHICASDCCNCCQVIASRGWFFFLKKKKTKGTILLSFLANIQLRILSECTISALLRRCHFSKLLLMLELRMSLFRFFLSFVYRWENRNEATAVAVATGIKQGKTVIVVKVKSSILFFFFFVAWLLFVFFRMAPDSLPREFLCHLWLKLSPSLRRYVSEKNHRMWFQKVFWKQGSVRFPFGRCASCSRLSCRPVHADRWGWTWCRTAHCKVRRKSLKKRLYSCSVVSKRYLKGVWPERFAGKELIALEELVANGFNVRFNNSWTWFLNRRNFIRVANLEKDSLFTMLLWRQIFFQSCFVSHLRR